VSPTIDAALIAALSAGGVAIVSFVTNARTTSRTLDAARRQRLWDRQAEVYEEIFAYCGHRKEQRNNRFRTLRLVPIGEKIIQDVLDSYKPPPWFEFQGRVLAFSSDDVAHAFVAAHEADELVWQYLASRDEAIELGKQDPAMADPNTVVAMGGRAKNQRGKADRLDDLLLDLLRQELLDRPRRPRWSHFIVPRRDAVER
jgi:hypothetical protein